MEQLLLNTEAVPPDEAVLSIAMRKAYPVYVKLTETIAGADYGITGIWNYYKDGKAWLFKASWKKKTVFWLSVWDGYFKVGFYFNEKNSDGIAGLPIDPMLKESFTNESPIGKLRPLSVRVDHPEQLDDLLSLIRYKQNCK